MAVESFGNLAVAVPARPHTHDPLSQLLGVIDLPFYPFTVPRPIGDVDDQATGLLYSRGEY